MTDTTGSGPLTGGDATATSSDRGTASPEQEALVPGQPARGSGEAVRSGGRDGDREDQVRVARAEITQRTERIRALSDELRDAKRELAQTQKRLTAAEARYARLRGRLPVRVAVGIGRVVRRSKAAGSRLVARVFQGGRARPGAHAEHRLRATEAEASAFRKRLTASLAGAARVSGPLVSIIVPTRDGKVHLERLIDGLGRLAYRDVELIVVDNGSTDGTAEYLAGIRARYPLHVVRNEVNASYSEANNQGAAVATGELLLLVNNDIEPAGPHVLGHMVERLLGEPGTAAVGARLIYPRRKGPRMGPVTRAADLTLQHRGIGLRNEGGILTARNLGAGEDPLGEAAVTPRSLIAATAACLLIRRADFDAVDGFTVGYDYGSEDVDLCLKLHVAGRAIGYEPQAAWWHYESATQNREDVEERDARRLANRARLADRFGPQIYRWAFLDRLDHRGLWSTTPLHVAITLTRDDPEAGWGDWHTAHELGEALAQLGWRVSYLERWHDHWYEPDPSVDVVVSLLDALDVRRLPDGVVTVAWVRNWTDRWLKHPWFDEYDLVLASSERSRELIDANSVHVAQLMPLATNPARFAPDALPTEPAIDAIFTGNRWGEERPVARVLMALAATGRTAAIHGRGWEAVPEVASIDRGPLPYDELPAAYARAAIVIDDTAGPTLPYGAVNARVFDALAVGTLVVTDNVEGARELFGDLLPAAGDPEAMAALATRFLDDPVERARRATALREVVLAHHTYRHRADQLREALRRWATAPRFDIAIGAPNWERAHAWGDYHFARGLQRALLRAGHPARVRLRDAWDAIPASYPDIAVHLFGLSERRPRPGQVSVLWVISHPELLTTEQLAAGDVVFAASDSLASALTTRSGRPVRSLHQATDPARFRPTLGGPPHQLLFVANSRGVRRPVVDELTPTSLDLAVYGSSWTPELLDPRHLRGEYVPNERLAEYYGAASIVLNDHWADMVRAGILSNRLYDAAASGAFVISDLVAGIDQEFDGGIATFVDGTQLRELVANYLAAPDERRAMAARARAAVLARHTFDHRAVVIIGAAVPLALARQAGGPAVPRPGAKVAGPA
jgi:GT2 family glycosyltransferase/spore maturation protein CgeB